MYKQKLGISISNSYQKDISEVIKIIKSCGFDAISPEWSDCGNLELISNEACKNNLTLQSLHAPFSDSAKMWSSDKNEAEAALKPLLLSLDDAHKYEIPILVVHTWIGFDDIPAPSASGVVNYEKLVNKASEYKIKIAFENTEAEDFLETLMNYFADNDTVGFCWDSGHEMCYSHSKDLLKKYGSKLIMTHLNDNLGVSRFDGKIFWTDDLHLLPFDGIADWDYNAKRLKKCKIPEFLNFELNIASRPNRHENDSYMKMTLEEYFTEAYKRACRVAYKLY